MANEKGKTPGSGLPVAFAVITILAASGGAGLAFVLPKPAPAAKPLAATTDAAESPKDGGGPSVAAGHDKQGKGGHGDHGGKSGHGQEHGAKKAPPIPVSATKLKEIAPITTNLAGEKAPWVRLEGALLYDPAIENEMTVMASRVTDDFIVYLRSVKLSEISGSGGLQALVEDLNERARIRSNGKVHQFVVSAFIIE